MNYSIDNYILALSNNGFYFKEKKTIINKVLNNLREEYSVKEICDKFHISNRMVYHYINEKRTLPVKLLLQFIQFLNKPEFIDELYNNKMEIFTWGHSANTLPLEYSNELAYLSGLICGDGHISNRTEIFITGDSKGHLLNYVLPLFKKLFNYTPKYINFNTYGRIDVNSKPISFFFKEVIGIPSGKKKGILRVPDFVYLSNDFKIHFLRGLFDADGSVTFSKDRYSILISSSTYPFLIQIQDMLRELGILIMGPYKSGNRLGFEIRTYKKDVLLKFADIIGSEHPKKKQRLNAFVAQSVEHRSRIFKG